jgi:hypothetical protein
MLNTMQEIINQISYTINDFPLSVPSKENLEYYYRGIYDAYNHSLTIIEQYNIDHDSTD